MILEKETELAKINKELKDLEHYKVSCQVTIYLCGCQQHCKHWESHVSITFRVSIILNGLSTSLTTSFTNVHPYKE